MAVVKSNAYGHGMLAVAKRLEKKVAYFFVDKFEDARPFKKKEIFKLLFLLESSFISK